METAQNTPIELFQDKEFEEDVGPYYGTYLGTFVSARGQVRADLFDATTQVIAYVSFPTGMNASSVEDRYVAVLDDYAAKHGFEHRFKMVYSES